MPSRRRQRHCFAPGCDTGYKWAQGEQPSLFAVPKDEAKRKVWERNLHRKDKVLDESCSVCERHFEPSYILRDYVHSVEAYASTECTRLFIKEDASGAKKAQELFGVL